MIDNFQRSQRRLNLTAKLPVKNRTKNNTDNRVYLNVKIYKYTERSN